MTVRTKRIFGGILAANAAAFVLMGLAHLCTTLVAPNSRTQPDGVSLLFFTSDFILVPTVMGVILAVCWKDVEFKRIAFVGYNTLNLALSLGQAVYFLKEGGVCIVMASPLVLPWLAIGFSLGKSLIARNNKRLNFSLGPLILIVLIADVVTTQGYDGQVVDKIVVRAPPAAVWRYIVAYPAIPNAPDYWLWKLGLPAPIQSTATGEMVGAQRKCIFTDNKAFDERITRLTPEKELTFDITTQPNDPEVIGHFVLHRGQFLLQDNGDGTTTVIGTSWYTLNVHPAWYYDLWVQDIVRHVHLRVMEHIKALAESDQKTGRRSFREASGRSRETGMIPQPLAAQRHVAAIDRQFRAGDETGVVAAQEQDGAGDLAGLAQPLHHGKPRPDRLPFLPVSFGGFGHLRRPRPAGADDVDPNMRRRHIERLTAGESENSPFGRVVSPTVGLRDMPGDAADIDDRAASTRLHGRVTGLRHIRAAAHVDAERTIPIFRRTGQALPDKADGTVHQPVQPSVFGSKLLNCQPTRFRIRDIDLEKLHGMLCCNERICQFFA